MICNLAISHLFHREGEGMEAAILACARDFPIARIYGNPYGGTVSMPKCVSGIMAAALVVLLPSFAAAQTSGIAGEVKDTSGAVLPGVTVEVTSPALIEKVRTAVTDDAGRYSIIQLRPGIYTVTFALPGFSTVKRDGIELTADFTAPVNADMRIGAIEETITVAAETPVVDVQSITTRTVMTRDVLDA